MLSRWAREAPNEERWERKRLLAFLAFQLIFWGAHFAIRTLAAIEHRPEYAFSFLGSRVLITGFGLVATTAVFFILLRVDHWTQISRMALALGLCAALLGPANALERFAAERAGADVSEVTFLDYVLQFGWAYLMWAGYYFAQDATFRTRRSAKSLARAQALVHEAQLQMLRHQLNPHFLFNTLNSISTLVLEGRNGEAEVMLMNLSRFLRRVAEPSSDPLTRLGDEAELQRMYLEVEAVRFGDKLQVACSVPSHLGDCLVPSLLLQPIVENAIKHGIAMLPQGGWIYIDARKQGEALVLSVENDGPPAPMDWDEASGIGIQNTRERLRILFGDKATCRFSARPNGGVRVEIAIPHATAPAPRELYPA